MPNPVVVLPGYYGTTLVDSVSGKVVWLTLDGVLHSGQVLDTIPATGVRTSTRD